MSAFHLTSGVYENAHSSYINLIKIENNVIDSFQKNITKLFLMVDRNDQEQKQISLRVWILRSTVLFTLLDFDDELLGLTRQLEDLKALSSCFPLLSPAILNLESNINLILKLSNPKRDWLLNALNDGVSNVNGIGILRRLSSGHSPGWPKEIKSYLPETAGSILYIQSSKEYKNRLLDKVVFPCGCSNCPHQFLINLIYSGVTSHIDILLYPGERFNLPKRLTLPIDSKLQSKFQKTVLEMSVTGIPQEDSVDSIDRWVNTSFWDEIHSGDRCYSESLVPAHYVLFNNGTGTFLPKNGKAQVLAEYPGQLFTSENINFKNVENLSAGDLVVLRSGDSVFLLDFASDNILHKIGSDNLLEDATEWKAGLEALFQTYTWEDVANELKTRNVNVTTVTVQRWAGPDGLGPGNEKDFRALISLLIEHKKIVLTSQSTESYISDKWFKLQQLRGVRHKAGQMIRNELFEALARQMHKTIQPIGDKTVIHLDVQSGVELNILRIFTVDHVPSYVHPSKIGRIDDLRNNKWLG